MTEIGEGLVRRLLDEQLRQRPRLHDDYLHDAAAHAAVNQGCGVLAAVADSMQAARLPFDVAEHILRETIDRLLAGCERDAIARGAAMSLPSVGGAHPVSGETRVMAVLCSEGPENGRRFELGRTGPIALGDLDSVQVFAWDGTFDQHGDARYRPEGAPDEESCG